MKFPDVERLLSATRSAIAQVLGTEYMENLGDLSALDNAVLVDVGHDVTDGNAPATDSYVKALISVIAEQELMDLEVKDELAYLVKKNFEWGGFVERVYYSLADVIDDPMYNLVNGRSYADIEHKFYQPKVKAKIFDEAKAVMVPMSFAEEPTKEAFTGWDKMNAFVAGIRNSVRQTIKLVIKAYSRISINTAVAIACHYGNAIHALTEFYGEDYTITAQEALRDKDFLSYLAERITELRDNMLTESTAFNNHTLLASASNVDLVMLNKLEKAFRFRLLADTFHKDIIALGDYATVTAWQGVAETDGVDTTRFAFDTISKIMIEGDADNKLGIGTEDVTISNVVALLHDHRAIGCCPYRMKLTSTYTACADFWNEFQHMLVNWMVDSNCNMYAVLLD